MDEGVRVIYSGGYTHDIGVIIGHGDQNGWLVYRHPDGQWVTLADIKPFIVEIMLMEPALGPSRDANAMRKKEVLKDG